MRLIILGIVLFGAYCGALLSHFSARDAHDHTARDAHDHTAAVVILTLTLLLPSIITTLHGLRDFFLGGVLDILRRLEPHDLMNETKREKTPS